MVDYKELQKNKPSLFSNQDAPIKILSDDRALAAWQEQRRQFLYKSGEPVTWADIGIILDDPYNIIVRDLVQFPDGDIRGYTRSIATATLKGGRGVVVFPEYQGKILLLHQYRHPTRQWHYEVPRGYGEPDIPAVENAHKEIEEETGGKVSELVDLGELYNNTGYESASVALFYARLISVGTANVNEGIESFVWLTVKELEEWIANGRITDGFTIAAYTRAKLKGLI